MNDLTSTSQKAYSEKDLLLNLTEVQIQQRQLISNLSHELRTPLTLVYGYIESIYRHSDNLTEQQKNALEIAIFEMKHTIHVLQESLDLARLDSQQIGLFLESVPLHNLILDVVTIYRNSENRDIIAQAEDLNLAVLADPDRLKQVLLRLIDNALKYSDTQIVIRVDQAGDFASISICDQGCGIPPQDQAHIFNPFYRVDHSRNRRTGGVGLGLSIAKTLVEKMGGNLSVHSQPGEGTAFTIMLKRPFTV